jgi:hypothetical protein
VKLTERDNWTELKTGQRAFFFNENRVQILTLSWAATKIKEIAISRVDKVVGCRPTFSINNAGFGNILTLTNCSFICILYIASHYISGTGVNKSRETG